MQDLEARGERQTVAGVHHKMLPGPQQLAVNMELLRKLIVMSFYLRVCTSWILPLDTYFLIIPPILEFCFLWDTTSLASWACPVHPFLISCCFVNTGAGCEGRSLEPQWLSVCCCKDTKLSDSSRRSDLLFLWCPENFRGFMFQVLFLS